MLIRAVPACASRVSEKPPASVPYGAGAGGVPAYEARVSNRSGRVVGEER